MCNILYGCMGKNWYSKGTIGSAYVVSLRNVTISLFLSFHIVSLQTEVFQNKFDSI